MAIATFHGSPKDITIAPVSPKATNHTIQSTGCWVGLLLTSCFVVAGLTAGCTVHFLGPASQTEIDECSDHSCLHGAICVDQLNGYRCLCVDGYDGDVCEIEIDECNSSYHSCLHGATCVDKLNGYTCLCVDGYDGDFCEIEIDECSDHSCLHGAKCVDKLNEYRCLCVDGYDGDFCEIEIDECSDHSCLHGATCVDKLNGYECLCVDGYDGDFCETEIDECSDHSCLHGAKCVDKLNGYRCLCVDRYDGDFCEIEIDECSDHSCIHGATCVDKLNVYQCLCVDGYDGDFCEIDTDECVSQPCANGGTCVDDVNGFYCECMPGYAGENCENDICLVTSPCNDGWACLSHPHLYTCMTDPDLHVYTCQCPTGYAAPYCQKTCFNMTLKTGEVTSLTAGGVTKHVYLETTEPGSRPWIVLLRRQDGSTDFLFRDWADYKNGFGQLTGEFWLGNDFVHRLTSNGSDWEVRFDLMRPSQIDFCLWAQYSNFSLASESDNYRLNITGYDSTSTADDLMTFEHNGQQFGTVDRDLSSSNCAAVYGCGWWYGHYSCHDVLLTGKYGNAEFNHGIVWEPWQFLLYADMKIRPRA